MWRSTVFAVLLLILCPFAFSQNTVVTGTITDQASQPWNNGNYSFSFQPSPSNPSAQYFFNGVPFNKNTTLPAAGPGQLSAGATLSIPIPPNTSITPSGSTWLVTVCPAASSPCFSTSLTITGATQNISTLVIPPAIVVNLTNPVPGVSAYTDGETVGAKTGVSYFNLSDSTIHVCTGFPPCTWVSIGSSASILPSNNTFTGINTFTQTIVGNISGNAGTATTASSAGSLNAPSALPNLTTAQTQPCTDITNNVATDLYVASCSGGGGGGSPAGNNGDVQIRNGSVFAAGGENDNGSSFNVSRTQHNAGPDPWNDICLYGSLCGNPASSTNATTTSGLNAITVASAANFLNGQGVTIYNAGAATSITALGAITLTPSLNAGGFNTITANAGSTPFAYKVVAADKFGGYLAATTAVSTTTGNPLGIQAINITSMARSGTTVTVTTSAAHPFVVGSEVYIKYNSTNADTTFNGFFIITAVPNNTHFSYSQGFDTTLGATASDTGGVAAGFTTNTLSWTPVSGAFRYYIYGRTGGSFNLIGQTLDKFWVDYGSPMNDNQSFPPYIPTTAPASGANDHLTARIVSGAGSTSLVLSVAAGTSITNTILSDDGPAIKAACGASQACYIPTSGARINSYTSLSSGTVRFWMGGSITLADSLEFSSSSSIDCSKSGSNTSFAFLGCSAAFNGTTAYPVISVTGNGVSFNRMSLASSAQNGALLMSDYADNGIGGPATNITVTNSTMLTSTSAVDYLGQQMIWQSDGFGFRFDFNAFLTGSPGTNANTSIGNSPIPSIVFKNQLGNGGAPTGNFAFTRSWFVARTSVDQDFSFNSGGQNYMIFQDIETQNSFLPQAMITGTGCCPGSFIDILNISGADFPTAFWANLAGTTNFVGTMHISQVTPVQGGYTNTTGAPMNQVESYNVANLGQNGSTRFAPSNFSNLSVEVAGSGNIGYAMSPPTAPTVSINGASGPPANTYTYSLAAVDTGGRQSSVGLPSAPITVNGSQGVNVIFGTPSPGQVATTVCRAAGGATVCATTGAGFQITGTNFIDNGGFFPNQSTSQTNTGAASTVINANGSATFAQKIVANNFATTITGTSTAARAQALADVSGTFCYTTSNCVNVLNGAFYGYTTNGWNACIAASESTHLFCDERGSPSITFPTQMNFGDIANDFGGIFLPCGQTMGSTITNGTSTAFMVYPNFSVIGCGVFANGSVLQTANSSTSVANIFATSGQTGYYEFHGFVVRNNCSSCVAATSGNGVDLSGMVDGSSWGHLSVFDYHETNIMHLSVNCCSTNVDNIVLRGDSNTTCTPSCSTNGLLIDYTGTSVSNYAMNITQSSIGHVSAGGSLIVLNNSGGGAAGKVDVNLGLHFSEMTTGATGPCIDVSGNVLVHFAQIEGCATTGATIQVENSGIPSVSFDSLHIGGGGATSIAVKNLNTSLCAASPCNTLTDANGYRTYFTTYVTNTSSASPAAEGNAQMGAFVIAAAASSVVVNTTQTPDDISKIDVRFNTALGTRLGVTCNTTGQQPFISASTPGTSFTVNVNANFTTNPGCFTFSIK